jgi:signal recognition particle GTPase
LRFSIPEVVGHSNFKMESLSSKTKFSQRGHFNEPQSKNFSNNLAHSTVVKPLLITVLRENIKNLKKMSRLGILGIRGIRSYSNYDKDSEDISLKVIDFSKGPVTLILGENGCGKTVSIFHFWLKSAGLVLLYFPFSEIRAVFQ